MQEKRIKKQETRAKKKCLTLNFDHKKSCPVFDGQLLIKMILLLVSSAKNTQHRHKQINEGCIKDESSY
jgi:hypothetical protein